MKALVYGGPSQRTWIEVEDPKIIDPRDAIIKVDTVTICGTDLHILKGDVPEVIPGRILGHEAVGTVVAVVGAGPIGLAAILTAQLYSPSVIVAIDKAQPRLDAARAFGATMTMTPDDDPLTKIQELTGGLGADVVIEAVGVPETFELCTTLVRPGGRVANIGVHGKPATLHLEDLWIRNVTITTGLVDTYSTPTLLKMLEAGQLDVSKMVTHRFTFDEFMTAYDVFADPAGTGALKVVVSRG
jgi:alcohol dehydrogenase